MRHCVLGSLFIAASLLLRPAVGHAADYLADARAALDKGDLKTAQIELRNAVRSDPQNAAARFMLAKVQLELGDPAAAEQQAREADTRGYDKLATTPLIGEALLKQGRPADLLRQFQPSGTDAKLDSEINFDRGAAEMALGHPDEAKQSFAEAQRLNPSNVRPWIAGARLALTGGDLKAGQDQLEHALAADAKSVEARVLKAQLLAQNHDTAGALALLDAVVADSPPAVPARLMRANILIATGKFKEAQADDDAVLAVLPNELEALYLKAVLEHETGHEQDADTLLQRIAPVFDRMPRGYFLQALVKENLHQLDLAEDAARKFTARVPGDPGGAKVLGRIQFERGRPDLAIEALNKLVTDGKADAQSYELLARAYSAVGEAAPGLAAVRKAQEMAPDDVGLHTVAATLLLQLNRPDDAVQEFDRAFELAPQQPQVAEALFLAALRTGDNDKVAVRLGKIRAAQGDTSLVQNLEGLLKINRFDLRGAQSEFEAIAQKNPDFMPAKINLARVLAMQGDQAGSEKILSAILDKAPAAEPALTMLTQSLISAGKQDQALAVVERAHAAAPKDVRLTQSLGDLYIRAGTPQKALDLVESSSPKGNVETQLLGLQAAAQLASKQNDQARTTLTRMVAEQPRNLAARHQLAALLVQAGDNEGARNLIKAGIAAMPDNYQLYVDYALVDLKAGGIDAALATADRLYEQNRTFAPAMMLKGDVYMANGQPAEAAKAYQAVAASAPSALATARIAGALDRAGKPDEVEAVLKSWFTAHPDDAEIGGLLGAAQISRGKFADAKATFQAILAKRPNDPAALNNLAWIDQKLGAPGAKDLARQAYALGPSPQTADTLGWILTTGGDPSTGAILLRQASAESTDPRIQYHFAVALKDTGQKEQAVKLLKRVVAAEGQFEEKTAAEHLLSEMSKGS
jgi:putative PEP-CTERM system TPR-repeat lipoprotein